MQYYLILTYVGYVGYEKIPHVALGVAVTADLFICSLNNHNADHNAYHYK